MDLIFVAPSTRHPSGGVAMIYEFAGAMAERGHRVHLYHMDFFQADVSDLDDIDWFSFPDAIEHSFLPPGPPNLQALAPADIVFGFNPELPPHAGLPVVLIQGYDMLGEEVEHAAFTAPCPKVCIATWLLDIGRRFDVPAHEMVHVPLGLRPEKYRLTRPVAGRRPRVSVCYSPHVQKCPEIAIDVLEAAKRTVPEMEAILFGAVPLEHELPSWATYALNPHQAELVDGIYNTSRAFLCTSRVEGFGLSNVEAMAGGATLVTTDNGGSHDYAFHDRTALVAPVGDVDALAAHVVALLRDDDRRIRLAEAGLEHVRRFRWDRSAIELESFLEQYLGDPAAFGWRAPETAPVADA